MKVVAFNGSPRKDGNTSQSLNIVLEELSKHGIDTELIDIAEKPMHGCKACGVCAEKKNSQCVITSDNLNYYLRKMIDADGIIIGSPVYFSNITPEVTALIDRAGYVSRANGNLLSRKVGASVVAMRRAGGTFAFSAINFFFLVQEMVVPGSDYWNIGLGRASGDVMSDTEGVNTFLTLGTNMAWLLEKVHHVI